jgi:CheY-like chemotaxis protein
MPGISGAEVIRRLRGFPGLAQARYVLSTGDREMPASGDELSALGVSTVVEKPYEIDVLRRAVEEGRD